MLSCFSIFLNDRFPVYAGGFLPDFKSDEELETSIKAAIPKGASGISFFGNVDEKTLSILANTMKTISNQHNEKL